MFISHDPNECNSPFASRQQGSRYWTRVQLQARLPFFIGTWPSHPEDPSYTETHVIVCGGDLLAMIESRPPLSIERMDPDTPRRENWSMQNIQNIWLAISEPLDGAEILVLQDQKGTLLTHFGASCSVPKTMKRLVWTHPGYAC